MLLDDIINSLADDTKSLTGALLKTKILLHKLGAPELVAWVNSELNGYTNSEELPPYRIVHGVVKANVSNIAMRYSDHPIPVMHLVKKARENLERPELGMPIATMESLTQGEGSSVTRPIPMEFNHKLGEKLGHGFHVESAWIEIAKSAVVGILGQVRSRLLDFLLELRDKAGTDASDQQVEEAAKNLNLPAMFNGAIFGDNVTIQVGAHNVQRVAMHVTQGDDAGLEVALRSAGLLDHDINVLQAAIANDRTTGAIGYDGKVGRWYFELLKKAGKGAASVGTEVVTGVVTKLLQQFLGLPG
jgi:hypothetical protein